MKGWMLALIDVGLFYIATAVAFTLRFGTQWPLRNWIAAMRMFPFVALAVVIIVSLYDLRSNTRHKTLSELVASTILANVLLCIIYLALSFWSREFALPRSILMISCFVNTTLQVAFGALLARFDRLPSPDAILLVANSNHEADNLVQHFRHQHRHQPVSIFIATPPYPPVAELLNGVSAIVIGSDVDKVYRSQLITRALIADKHLQYIPDGSDVLSLSTIEEPIGDMLSLTYVPLKIHSVYLWLKRCVDIVLSILLLMLFSIPMLVLFILIPYSSPGDAIYTQTRVGLDGKKFRMYKFRTMIADAEKHSGPTLSTAVDQRVTRLGRVLRSTRLDETPQLINVLKGDMSLIGPRPERPEFVRVYHDTVPAYSLRHLVRPGLTGLAQVTGGYAAEPVEKLRYDLWYIRHYNPILDLKILFRTVVVMLHPQYTKGIEPNVIDTADDTSARVQNLSDTAGT